MLCYIINNNSNYYLTTFYTVGTSHNLKIRSTQNIINDICKIKVDTNSATWNVKTAPTFWKTTTSRVQLER